MITPPGFYIHHFIKDLEIALADAETRGLEVRALRVALELYRALAASGAGNQGTQALIEAYAALPDAGTSSSPGW